MKLELDEKLFKDLYPFIIDDNVTDIKWNGRNLWIDDLTKGRYLSNVILSESFLEIFTARIASYANVHFNVAQPSLQAETESLRIHAIHPYRTGDHTYILAIRKTPAKKRLNNENIISKHYADQLFIHLIGGLIRAHISGIIIGDVGSGKTELEKYIAGFIPDNESCLTVEDTLEMKLPLIYPEKDISSVKIDHEYTAIQAIRDALRLLTKWLLIAEARGREISSILEGASTGCVAWSTIHAENTWEIPDRVVQMAGVDSDKEAVENNVYMFFSIGIKVKREVTSKGIYRKIDQICFFDRNEKKNKCYIFMKDGQYTGCKIPQSIVQKLVNNKEKELLELLNKEKLL